MRGAAACVEADVCVIGCGPAGITVARELVAAGAKVVLLESGSRASDGAAAELLSGRASGPVLKDYPTYLRDSRRTGIGGSGAGWGTLGRMWCIPLSALDFEPREWVADSGWPLRRSELAPYEQRAAELLGLAPFADSAGGLPAPPTSLVSQVYRFPANSCVFRKAFRALAANPGFRAELGATATGLHAAGGVVERIDVVCAGRDPFAVTARIFVLATGGIENARLLLLGGEDGAAMGGPALGRYFMEHFHVAAGTVRLPDPNAWQGYIAGGDELGVIGLDAATQRRLRLLNACAQLSLDDAAGPPASGPVTCGLFVRAEQAPNPESRVTLGAERDSLGRRRAVLEWNTLPLDWESVVASATAIATELESVYGANVDLSIEESAPWPWPPTGPAESPRPTWGNHHMGTTRMSDHPSSGVVDARCRVHGTSNLFVAGSSVFPTSGYANPTFTITALALRLADEIVRRLSFREGSLPRVIS